MYRPRLYRNWVKNRDLVSFSVVVEESDCLISATCNLSGKARSAILKYREILKKYISSHPHFGTSLEPVETEGDAPLLVKAMAEAGRSACVGPMASVAGAIAFFTGQELLKYSPEIIIENGGDIFIRSLKKRVVGIYAGNSPLSGKIGLELEEGDTPCGISTSSGTFGHSLSFGKADAVVVLAENAVLSDAPATAFGNLLFTKDDFQKAIDRARGMGVRGLVMIKDDQMALWGDIRITAIQDFQAA